MPPPTIAMMHQKIAGSIRSALCFLYPMANIPSGALSDWLLTIRTSAILHQPDTIELPTAPRRVQHFFTPPGFEILRPLRIIRVGIRFNLGMPPYGGVRLLEQNPLSLRTLFFFSGGKGPVSGPSGFKVFLFNPSGALIGMPPGAHCHSIDQIALSFRAKVCLATTWL